MDVYSKILEKCLENSFDFFASLPCSYNIHLIRELEGLHKTYECKSGNTLLHIPLVREESGVALSAGAYMGGRRTAMVIQNQGLGNMLGQLFSFNSQMQGSYKIPNLYIISHRGTNGEKIEAQKPMGKRTPDLLELADIKYCVIEKVSDLKKFDDLLVEYEKGYSIALLVKPNYINPPERIRNDNVIVRRYQQQEIDAVEIAPEISRYKAIEIILNNLNDEFVLSNIGHPSRELCDIHDRDRNFYLTSSLSQSYMLGLGFALTVSERNQKVICFEGDGGILMNASSLSLVAQYAPKNFILIVLDNGVYGSTGNTDTYAKESINISGVAQVYGFHKEKIFTLSKPAQIQKQLAIALKNNGPHLFHILVTETFEKVPTIPLSNIEIKARFMKNIE
ncbi:MAG: putative Sulfopyruvate decarboxylase [Promethearchaeota archaeon]|nr:MAG: putative Sulfopyruvate decarboxylase [Candidatus Lokiarchaeota archaeon]